MTKFPDSRIDAARLSSQAPERPVTSPTYRSPLTVAGPCRLRTHFAWPPGQRQVVERRV